MTRLPDEGHFHRQKAHFQVDEEFGGLPTNTAEVDVMTGLGNGDCGYPFQVGQQYLVYASLGNDGKLHTGSCTYTRPATNVGAVLFHLRRLKSGQPQPALIGQISRAERTFSGFLGKGERWTPLPGFRLRIKSQTATFETTSTPEGFYWFDKVPPGDYRLEADLPPDVSLTLDRYERPPLWKRENYCAELNPTVISNASIEGRVFNQLGEPIYGSVTIFPASAQTLPDGKEETWESTDEKHPFRFTYIPPGDYLLMVNSTDKVRSATPYHRTFYPSALDRASARPITVHPGEHLTGIDIHTTSALPRGLTVQLQWADGRPVNARTSIFAIPNGNSQDDDSGVTNIQGVAHLNLAMDTAYEISTEVKCADADRFGPPYARVLSAHASLAPGDRQDSITLTLPAAGCPAGSSPR